MSLFLAIALTFLWPSIGFACAVCGRSDERNADAFLSSTIVMSLLPLMLLGGGILWIRKKSNETPDDPEDQTE